MIPYGCQSISEQDIQAVVEVLQSDCLTQGANIHAFERGVAEYCKAEYAVAVSSGTAALHLACKTIGFGPGDILWTSAITFVASANCALFCGGEVDFVDIDPRSYNLSTDALEQKLRQAESEGRLPKVVVPVHFAGQSCDMKRIRELSHQYGFYVIEDACHALGGRYNNTSIGGCQYSDLTVFSFHPLKSITTGEGGMVLSNDKQFHQRLLLLRSHGVTKEPANLQNLDEGGWYYEQQALGYNYRMTDIQAALGRSQLQRLDEFILQRSELAQRYDDLLCDWPLNIPWRDPSCDSAHHLYPVTLHGGTIKRRHVYDSLRDAGVQTQVHYIPVHTQPFYRERGFEGVIFPNAEAYYESTLSLPLYASMSHEVQDQVVTNLREALQ
jgi:UDP-4-amino-4,6-dideoxy-N-acetyl-beta-L-altrosamine transaminase